MASRTDVSAAPLSLLLFDLNGFKVSNDTFGRTAGDALLARMAGNLAAAVADHGSAYRIGGDEFCVLVDGDCAGGLGAVRDAASSAPSQEGQRSSISASHAVGMPDEAPTATQALRLADERMYSQKAARSNVACRPSHDVLLQIVDERDPALHSHGDNVARIAVAIGRRMGRSIEPIDKLAKAAALRDIGKGVLDADAVRAA